MLQYSVLWIWFPSNLRDAILVTEHKKLSWPIYLSRHHRQLQSPQRKEQLEHLTLLLLQCSDSKTATLLLPNTFHSIRWAESERKIKNQMINAIEEFRIFIPLYANRLNSLLLVKGKRKKMSNTNIFIDT